MKYPRRIRPTQVPLPSFPVKTWYWEDAECSWIYIRLSDDPKWYNVVSNNYNPEILPMNWEFL